MWRYFLIIGLTAAALLPASALADETIGGACSGTVAAGPQSANGNNAVCVSSLWQYPAYQFGNTSATCNSANAGIIRWTGAAFQGCNGTAWGTVDTQDLLLGSSTTANPYISGAVTSGFYTAASAKVDVEIAASKIGEWLSTGFTVSGTDTANSFIPTGSSIPTTGMYLPASNTVGLATSTTGALTISSGGNVNIVETAGALQLGGTTIMAYPDSDTTSLAIAPSALASQTTISLDNTAVGDLAAEFVSTGANNTAIGQSALLGITGTKTTGSNNTAIGASALLAAQGAAASNTVVGQSAGSGITTATNNTIIGYAVGTYVPLTTGSGNIAIGNDRTTDQDLANSTSSIAIGNSVQDNTADVGIGSGALLFSSNNGSIFYNVGIGDNAGYGITTGAYNTAVNWEAVNGGGVANLTGNYNTGIGLAALNVVQGAASYNTAVGQRAGANVTTGSNNTLLGSGAANSGTANVPLTTGSGNIVFDASGNAGTALGSSTSVIAIGYSSQGDTGSISIGYQSMSNVAGTGGSQYDVMIGYGAGNNITTGAYNVGIGGGALSGAGAVTGNDNTAVGTHALYNITTGAQNTSISGNDYGLNWVTTGTGYVNIGTDVMFYTDGTNTLAGGIVLGNEPFTAPLNFSYITAAGWGALYTMATASYNTAAGFSALYSVTTGQYDTALGESAGYTGTALTVATNDTLIGAETKANAANYTNSTALGYAANITASNSIVLGNSSIGHIYAEVTSITGISDRRRKKDIEDLDLGLEFIERLKPVSYRFTNGDATLRYGFIAQDLEQALPPELRDVVETSEPEHGLALIERENNGERTYRVGYSELLAPIVKATQQQQARIDALKAANAKQAAELDELRSESAALEAKP